jgi:hypothetical protein
MRARCVALVVLALAPGCGDDDREAAATRTPAELDRFFAEQMSAPGKPRRGGLLSEDRGARLFALASYTGEVISRNADGWRWVPAEDDPDDEINLQLERDGEVLWPVQRVMKRYENGAEDSLAAYVDAALEP